MGKKLRRKALHFAFDVCTAESSLTLARMWSWAVFYENYIDLGAQKTNKRMRIVEDTPVVPFKAVK